MSFCHKPSQNFARAELAKILMEFGRFKCENQKGKTKYEL